MNPPLAGTLAEASPQTQGLALFIQEAVAELRHRGSEDHSAGKTDGLLFLGNWHDAHPRLLFHDPVLEPVDKVIWTIIRHHAEPGKPTAFPTYQEIALAANVKSSATIARAIMILRLTRWISLCARVRDGQGRYRGNVYALHDEPASLSDTLHLDPEYLQFLEAMQKHHHSRVRRVATMVLNTIKERIVDGEDVTQDTLPIEQMERRVATLQGGASKGSQGSFSSVSDRQRQQDEANRLQNLGGRKRDQNLKTADEKPPQNLNSANKINEKQQDNTKHQNLNTVPFCCSSCIYIKTTTTKQETEKNLNTVARENSSDELCFPEQLQAHDIALARMHLAIVPEEQRQDVLDELQGRLRNANGSSEPIRNPIGYLAQLCNAARNGAFLLTSFGTQVRESRKQAAAVAHLAEEREEDCRRDAQSIPDPTDPLVRRIEQIRERQRQKLADAGEGVQGALPAAASANAESKVLLAPAQSELGTPSVSVGADPVLPLIGELGVHGAPPYPRTRINGPEASEAPGGARCTPLPREQKGFHVTRRPRNIWGCTVHPP